MSYRNEQLAGQAVDALQRIAASLESASEAATERNRILRDLASAMRALAPQAATPSAEFMSGLDLMPVDDITIRAGGYVTARNGTLYRDPVLVCRSDGWIEFDVFEAGECRGLLFQTPHINQSPGTQHLECNPFQLLDKALGAGGYKRESVKPIAAGMMLPFSPADVPRAEVPVVVSSFEFSRRIPTPDHHSGTTRYLRKSTELRAFTPGPHPNDAEEMHSGYALLPDDHGVMRARNTED